MGFLGCLCFCFSLCLSFCGCLRLSLSFCLSLCCGFGLCLCFGFCLFSFLCLLSCLFLCSFSFFGLSLLFGFAGFLGFLFCLDSRFLGGLCSFFGLTLSLFCCGLCFGFCLSLCFGFRFCFCFCFCLSLCLGLGFLLCGSCFFFGLCCRLSFSFGLLDLSLFCRNPFFKRRVTTACAAARSAGPRFCLRSRSRLNYRGRFFFGFFNGFRLFRASVEVCAALIYHFIDAV